MNNYNRIPEELKSFNYWINWKCEKNEDDELTKVPYYKGYKIDHTKAEEREFLNFKDAVEDSYNNRYKYSGLAYALSDKSPFTLIDFDDVEGNQELLKKQKDVFEFLPSYAETSPSGKGLHIIVKGKIPRGIRNEFLEIYPNKRFMTVTGNVFRDYPIVDCSKQLAEIYSYLKKDTSLYESHQPDMPQVDDDYSIICKAYEARNGEKFRRLYCGQWAGEWPTQSEADLALFNFLAIYTKNKEQIVRIFHASALGKRKKAQSTYHLKRLLNLSFDRLTPPVNIDWLKQEFEEKLANKKESEKANLESDVHFNVELSAQRNVESITATQTNKDKTYITEIRGLIADIAECVYKSAPRPVKDIALVAALGLMSGICGRSYNVSGTGLNQYILLLAPTGTGKESIAKGITKILNAVVKTVPNANMFIGPAKISSNQALTKYLSNTSNSFLSICGEFGLFAKQLCGAYAPAHMLGLRELLLDLYNKSGQGDVLRPTIYSEKEKNTNEVLAPAFTLLGESSPSRFYELLNEEMIHEGFLPRFSVIEYKGKRPEENENHKHYKPDEQFINRISDLCSYTISLNQQNKVIDVGYEPDAEKFIKQFRDYCDSQINDSVKEVSKQLWTRAQVKVLKLAALMAVGINPYAPRIDLAGAQWAVELVRADVGNFVQRFDSHLVGEGESTQEALLLECVRTWIVEPWQVVSKFKAGSEKIHKDKIVPYSYIHRQVANLATYRNDKRGSTEAVKRVIKNLIDKGMLYEMQRNIAAKDYKSSSVLYLVNPEVI